MFCFVNVLPFILLSVGFADSQLAVLTRGNVVPTPHPPVSTVS